MAETPLPSWKFRRGIVIFALAFSATTVFMALMGWAKDGIEETAITDAFMLIGAVVATYTGAATTHGIMKQHPNTEQ